MKYLNKFLIVIIIFLLFTEVNSFAQNFVENIVTSKKVFILPLGNSITFDSRSNDTRNIGEKAGYRAPLYNLLKNAGYNFDFIGSEYSGGNYLPAGYDENAGFPGISDDELAYLLESGHLLQLNQGIDRQITAGPYLNTYSPDIILLHIGTNKNDLPNGTSPIEVEQILDHIDTYETVSGKEVIVLLARIINRVPNENFVNEFNNNIESMALDRVNNPNNDAYPDNIVIIDMQDSAGINYVVSPDPDGAPGDMHDPLHPNNNGYAKMAYQWFSALTTVLPNPPVILKHPTDQFTIEGSNVSFSISVKSKEPVSYQWRKNGVNILFANDSVLTVPNIELADSNAIITCIVTNINGSVTSNSARLYVNDKLKRIRNGLIAEYDFEEGEGNIIHNKIINNNELDLNIYSTQSVNWISNGISITDISNISSSFPVIGINDTINYSNQFSFEIWLSTSQSTQSGPARIITISANGNERNFTLGQSSNSFIFRTRTTNTDLNGLPELSSQAGIVQDQLIHVVLTRNTDGFENIFINGILNENTQISGNLSNWNSNYKLAIGNEFQTDRPWLGNIYHLAIYNRELNIEEIQHNYLLGEDGTTDVANASPNLPTAVELYQNYPNPFNPTTIISFRLPESANVNLVIYNQLGEEVYGINIDQYTAGFHSINFNASELASGVYLYSIKAHGMSGKNYVATKKMILLK